MDILASCLSSHYKKQLTLYFVFSFYIAAYVKLLRFFSVSEQLFIQSVHSVHSEVLLLHSSIYHKKVIWNVPQNDFTAKHSLQKHNITFMIFKQIRLILKELTLSKTLSKWLSYA